MSHTLRIAIGSEGAWIARLDGSSEAECINLGSQHTLETLGQWLQDPDSFPSTYYKPSPLPAASRSVFFCTETGRIVIDHPVKTARQSFDPSNEESMAKFVRHMKRLAERYDREAEQQLALALPVPTENDLARRTIYANPANASGSGHRSHPRPRYNKPTVSAEKSRDLIAGILGNLAANLKD